MKVILFVALFVVGCFSVSVPAYDSPINPTLGPYGAIPMNYTLFKQCNSAWGSHKLGTSDQTICEAGCAMTSLSMVLNTYKELISGKAIDPLSFDTWLVAHSGFEAGDLLVWAAGDELGTVKFSDYYRGAGSLSASQLQGLVDKKHPVIVNVRAGTHWVLVIGYDGTNFYVNDPGFDTTSYAYSGMSNYIVYNV